MASMRSSFQPAVAGVASRSPRRTAASSRRSLVCSAVQRPTQATAAAAVAAALLAAPVQAADFIAPQQGTAPQMVAGLFDKPKQAVNNTADKAGNALQSGLEDIKQKGVDAKEFSNTNRGSAPFGNEDINSQDLRDSGRPELLNTSNSNPSYPNLAPTRLAEAEGGRSPTQQKANNPASIGNARSTTEQADATRPGGIISNLQRNIDRTLKGQASPEAPKGETLNVRNPIKGPELPQPIQDAISPLFEPAKREANNEPKAFEKDLRNSGY